MIFTGTPRLDASIMSLPFQPGAVDQKKQRSDATNVARTSHLPARWVVWGLKEARSSHEPLFQIGVQVQSS